MKKIMTLTGLLDVRQTAAALGCSPSTIRAWVWKREIECVRVGRSVRFRPEVIEAIIERGTVPTR